MDLFKPPISIPKQALLLETNPKSLGIGCQGRDAWKIGGEPVGLAEHVNPLSLWVNAREVILRRCGGRRYPHVSIAFGE